MVRGVMQEAYSDSRLGVELITCSLPVTISTRPGKRPDGIGRPTKEDKDIVTLFNGVGFSLKRLSISRRRVSFS